VLGLRADSGALILGRLLPGEGGASSDAVDAGTLGRVALADVVGPVTAVQRVLTP
jgi:hypothetical protein